MGRLVTFSQLTPDPSWHFETAWYDHDYQGNPWSKERGGWRYEPEKETSGVTLYVHEEKISDIYATAVTFPLRVEIRRWVEETIPDTVILSSDTRNYFVHHEYVNDKGVTKSTQANERRHIYYRFRFEHDESALMFKIKFGELVASEPTVLHPRDIGKPDIRARISGVRGYMDGNGRVYDY